ncbi:hypothetical protein SEVIR_7G023367v4 [Setaria viridis]
MPGDSISCAMLLHTPAQSNSIDDVTLVASKDPATPSATPLVSPSLLMAQSLESTQVRFSAPLEMPMTQGTAARNHPTTSPCPAPLLSLGSTVNPAQLVVVTPLQPVSPGTMATPDPERTYLHVSMLTCCLFSNICDWFIQQPSYSTSSPSNNNL